MKTQTMIAFAIVGVLNFSLTLEAQAHGGRGGERREPPAEVIAAFDACETELGILLRDEYEEPIPLADADRAELDTCLLAKGVNPPPHRGGGGAK